MSKEEEALIERVDPSDIIQVDEKASQKDVLPDIEIDEIVPHIEEHPNIEIPEPFSKAIAAADKARRKVGYWLGGASFILGVLAVGIVIYKAFWLWDPKHNGLAKAFINATIAGEREYRYDILTYLGIVVGAQSAVTICLIIWFGKVLRSSLELLIPIRYLNQHRLTDASTESLKLIEKLMKTSDKKK